MNQSRKTILMRPAVVTGKDHTDSITEEVALWSMVMHSSWQPAGGDSTGQKKQSLKKKKAVAELAVAKIEVCLFFWSIT